MRPDAAESSGDLGLLHPVAWKWLIARILKPVFWNIRKLSVLGPLWPVGVVSESVVEVMHHLCFDEGHKGQATDGEAVAVARRALQHEVRARLKMPGVVRHVKHGHQPHSPRIPLLVVGLAPENSGTLVHRQVDLRISRRTKRRARARVWIESLDVRCRKRELPFRIPHVLGRLREENSLRARARYGLPSQGQ